MAERKAIRGIDHFGMTVPDLEVATRFFEQAFDAKVLYDNITRADPPFPGEVGSTLVGMAPESTLMELVRSGVFRSPRWIRRCLWPPRTSS